MTNTQTTDLPAGWVKCKLSDLGEVVAGGTPSTKVAEYWGNEVAWISPADLSGYEKKHIGKGRKSLSLKGLNNSSARLMPTGSILFSSRAPIGYVAIAANELATNQGFKNLVLSEHIFNEYVYYYLKSAKQLAEKHASGTTFKEISAKVFGNLPIPLPPLAEQYRIVAKIEELFSDLDHSVAALETAQAQFKIYRQAVLKYAFEGKLTEKWRQQHTSPPAAELLAHIQAERAKSGKPAKPLPPVSEAELAELLGLPESWVWVKAEGVSEFITKGTTPHKNKLYSGDGEIPFIKVYNLTHTGRLDFSINQTFTNKATHKGFLARSIVFPGDVLMNIVGPPLGKVSLVPNLYPEWNINQAIVRYRPYSFLLNKYLKYFLLSEITVRNMERKSKATAGQFNLTLEICRELPIPLCSMNEQHAIVEEIEARLSVIDKVEETIETSLLEAEALRQSILKQAFAGKLVPQDPADEPAAILLERIKTQGALKTQKTLTL